MGEITQPQGKGMRVCIYNVCNAISSASALLVRTRALNSKLQVETGTGRYLDRTVLCILTDVPTVFERTQNSLLSIDLSVHLLSACPSFSCAICPFAAASWLQDGWMDESFVLWGRLNLGNDSKMVGWMRGATHICLHRVTCSLLLSI